MCEICKTSPCVKVCPNYVPKLTSYICLECGEGIYEGDEYIENLDGEYMHYECIRGLKHMCEFLGFEIKTMEEF